MQAFDRAQQMPNKLHVGFYSTHTEQVNLEAALSYPVAADAVWLALPALQQELPYHLPLNADSRAS